MDNGKQPFEHFALVELFGHQRIAGKVTESEIGGGKFIRVDVPAISDLQPLTRFYGPAAIYGITPVTEETTMALAAQLRVQPVGVWDARHMLKELKSAEHSSNRLIGLPEEDESEETEF